MTKCSSEEKAKNFFETQLKQFTGIKQICYKTKTKLESQKFKIIKATSEHFLKFEKNTLDKILKELNNFFHEETESNLTLLVYYSCERKGFKVMLFSWLFKDGTYSRLNPMENSNCDFTKELLDDFKFPLKSVHFN
ncbi:hypothetical protein HDU92_004678 [Lobulomyces angularis]|nr:hypothetical protein HDU92_004678 [Lobulomyces angularis]